MLLMEQNYKERAGCNIRHTKIAKYIQRYKTDKKYLSQYDFYNEARSWQLAKNLSS